MSPDATPTVAVGQIWERRNGTRFTIEHVGRGYSDYWLASGSKPQYRSIALENFKRYRLIKAEEARA